MRLDEAVCPSCDKKRQKIENLKEQFRSVLLYVSVHGGVKPLVSLQPTCALTALVNYANVTERQSVSLLSVCALELESRIGPTVPRMAMVMPKMMSATPMVTALQECHRHDDVTRWSGRPLKKPYRPRPLRSIDQVVV